MEGSNRFEVFKISSGNVRQAANLAMLEVDRGLLSSNTGEQCEAIMQFPNLIDQFPLPVLISSAFLKLTEKFVSSQNVIRQCVAEVIAVCSNHLHKVNNIEDIFKRISSVIHSNDPIARGLTLKVFGAMSPLIGDKTIVLQSILKGLDSNHQYEQHTAIESAHEICQHSRSFAMGVCSKVSDMIHDITIAMTVRQKLVHILQFMYHNVDLAMKARQLCIDLLSTYPVAGFTIVIISTLTKLAIATRIHAESQIALLIDLAGKSSQTSVRFQILSDLQKLALKCAHGWRVESIEAALELIAQTPKVEEKAKLLGIFKCLALSSASHLLAHCLDELLSLCAEPQLPVAARALNVLCCYAVLSESDMVAELTLVAESLLSLLSTDTDMVSFKVLCDCLTRLLAKSPVAVQIMPSLLQCMRVLDQPKAQLCCKVLGSLMLQDRAFSSFPCQQVLEVADAHPSLLYPVCVSLIQSHASLESLASRQSFTDVIHQRVMRYVHQPLEERYDHLFLLAREASCKGFHRLAGRSYHSLTGIVETEEYYYWLLSMSELSDSCSLLTEVDPTGESIQKAVLKGLAARQYAQASLDANSFIVRFITGYVLFSEALAHLYLCCNTSLGESARLPPKYNVSRFEEAMAHFQQLVSCSFDATSQAIDVLLDFYTRCQCVCHLLGSGPGSTDPTTTDVPSILADEVPLTCGKSSRVVSFFKELCAEDYSNQPLTVVLNNVKRLLAIPMPLPDKIFGSKQKTDVQVITQPSLSEVDSITVQDGRSFSLIVEGIIEQKHGCFRVPKEVVTTVTLTSQDSNEVVFCRRVKINADYFKACFSIHVSPAVDEYKGLLAVSLVDGQDKQWLNGPSIPFSLTCAEGKL